MNLNYLGPVNLYLLLNFNYFVTLILPHRLDRLYHKLRPFYEHLFAENNQKHLKPIFEPTEKQKESTRFITQTICNHIKSLVKVGYIALIWFVKS